MTQREIKFRAWDKTKKKMYFFDEIRINSEYNLLGFHSSEFNDYGDLDIDDENFELNQFTGLKDKNGKEIYEGDIIEFDYPMEIIWDMGSWVVKTKKGSSLLYGYVNDGKVIGNIYENSKLLKP